MRKSELKSLFVHFHPEEHAFVERSLDWIRQTVYNHQVTITPFLDPREQEILSTLIRREHEIDYLAEGGTSTAERRRVKLGPAYLMDPTERIPLAFLRITPSSKKRLEHREILGSILGLGIRRDHVGDIYPGSQSSDVIVTEEVRSLIRFHLTKVSNEKVIVEEIKQEEIEDQTHDLQGKRVIVSSLRLDAILSEGFRISRSKTTKLIKSGKCKVDWKVIDKPSYPIQEGNLLSLRGYGRLRVQEFSGRTKKGKFIIYLVGTFFGNHL